MEGDNRGDDLCDTKVAKDHSISCQQDKLGKQGKYSCPSLVVPFLEELISWPFLDENRFRLVSQDRMSA